MSEVPSDAELLERYIAAGDRDALDTLVRRHIDFVYAAARRQMRGRSDAAEDITQAVFLVLAKRAKTVPTGRLSGWLFRVTRYAAANARRAEIRRGRHERNSSRPEPAMPAELAQSAASNEMLSALDDALASLREADREALILRYLQGQDIAAVSAHFGTSEDTAQRRISRAVDRLRQAFAGRGFKMADATSVVGVVTLAAATKAPAATVAHVAAAAANTAAATASAAAISKSVSGAMWAAKLKVAATVAVSASIFGGAVVGVVRHYSAPASTPATPTDAYNGVWLVVRSDAYGSSRFRLPPSTVVRLSSGNGTLTLASLDDSDRRPFIFSSAGPPQQIDAIDDHNPALACRGLIEWRGDELWLAFGSPGGRRPATIGRGEASTSIPSVFTLRRASTGGT